MISFKDVKCLQLFSYISIKQICLKLFRHPEKKINIINLSSYKDMNLIDKSFAFTFVKDNVNVYPIKGNVNFNGSKIMSSVQNVPLGSFVMYQNEIFVKLVEPACLWNLFNNKIWYIPNLSKVQIIDLDVIICS